MFEALEMSESSSGKWRIQKAFLFMVKQAVWFWVQLIIFLKDIYIKVKLHNPVKCIMKEQTWNLKNPPEKYM